MGIANKEGLECINGETFVSDPLSVEYNVRKISCLFVFKNKH